MSWDLEFVPRDALPDVIEWLEQEREPDPDAARRHGEAVVASVPELRLAGPFDGGYQLVSDRDDIPLTVDLDGNYAALNVAYWEGTTDTTAPVVARLTAALAQAGPFVVFDPQRGEAVDPSEVEAAFRREHPRISKLTSRLVPGRPWYRRPWTLATAVVVVALVLHRAGAF